MSKAYEVIARRWRPQNFEDLVGQEHIIQTLSNAIKSNRIAHAFLLVGPRGTGKTSTARLLAKALNCENGPSITPENDSKICKAIMNGSCMDVIEIDGASNNSVEQIRQLRDECQYAPGECRFKIYIIDEVHMLSTAAFNALLKTLEEPPPHVKFIFATTESHKVLPTITSRCQRFEFRPIDSSVIKKKLSLIADAENVQIDPLALDKIARLADGGMRDAQTILDQMISFCGKSITENNVLEVYGLVSQESLKNLAQALASANYKEILNSIQLIYNEGKDLYRLLIDLQLLIREALIESVNNPTSTSTKLGHPLTTENIMRMLESLSEGENSLRSGLNAKINLESILLRAVDRAQTRSIDSLIKELSQYKQPSTKAETTTSVKQINPEQKQTPTEAPQQTNSSSNPEGIPASTKKILSDLYRAEYTEVLEK